VTYDKFHTIRTSCNIYLLLTSSRVSRDLLTSCITSTCEYGETPLNDGSFFAPKSRKLVTGGDGKDEIRQPSALSTFSGS